MDQVRPRSESTTQEQQEQYPNGWPKITAQQERIKLGLPAVPPLPEAPAETPKPKRWIGRWIASWQSRS